MNYASVFQHLAKRAIDQGVSNLEAFVSLLVEQGVPPEEVERQLLDDLMNDGPIFGSFFRSLSGAGEGAVLAAERQGSVAGAVDSDAELKRLLDLADMEDVIDDADPEALRAIEVGTAEHRLVTWVATLKNTCHLCLPLHGVTRTAAQWETMGLDPATIHPGSWASSCQCQFVDEGTVQQGDLESPLVRQAIKGEKKTTRAIASADMQRAQRARDAAMKSIEGRRLLRKLGQALGSDAEGVDMLGE